MLLLAGLAAMLVFSAKWSVGLDGVLFVLAGCGLGILFAPRLSSNKIMRWYGAQQIDYNGMLPVYDALRKISYRAGLTVAPELYYRPDGAMNSFAVGRRSDSAIAITDEMLRHLSMREFMAVLAHEVSHIAGNDIWVMQIADRITRMTRMMASIGIAFGLLSLPLAMFGGGNLPILPILALIFAPSAAALLQLALSRRREFEADRSAAVLTGDSIALASALKKVEAVMHPSWHRFLMPVRHGEQPSILRGHPPTAERIGRLQEMSPLGATQHGQGIPLPVPRIGPTCIRRPFWW